MDLAREDMESVGAKEGKSIGRNFKCFRVVVTPNREKPKEEKEEEEEGCAQHILCGIWYGIYKCKESYYYFYIYTIVPSTIQ